MKKIILEIRTEKALICTEYSNEKLKKISLKKGKITAEQWAKIGMILPPTTHDIEDFKQRFKQIEFGLKSDEKPPQNYPKFLTSWFDFYQKRFGFSPKFSPIDGKHLKEIIAYLEGVNEDEKQALATWEALLENWHNLDEFHQKNTDLKYINSQLNKILQNAKRFTTSGTKQGYSHHFKRKIFEALRTE